MSSVIRSLPLIDRLDSFGEATALAGIDWICSYAELHRRLENASAELREQGLPAGAVVGLEGDFAPDPVARLLALARHGAVAAPFCGLPPAEIEARLEAGRVGWRWVVNNGDWRIERTGHTESSPHPLIAQLHGTGHAGLLLFSSGSTGQPKAMLHDLDRLLDGYAGRRAKPVSLLTLLLFDHIGGLNTLFNGLAVGGLLAVPGTREPAEVCELIARHRVQVLPGSPTFLNLLLLSGAWREHDLSSLRVITYGTEPMLESLLLRLKAAFPKVRLIQTFGTSETGIAKTVSKASDSVLLRFDDPEIGHRVVDGELWLRSRTQILGYLNHSMDSFTPDGWFRTGDLVEEAGEGFFRIVGRLRDIINVGGRKVAPSEVESVLLEIPEVAEVRVFALPNPITGQAVAAEVVWRPAAPLEEVRRKVRTHCASRLENWKIPVKITAVESMPASNRLKKVRS